jgi:hypothetical protein
MFHFGRATPRLGSATPRHNRVGFALSRQGRQARYRLDVVDRADRRRQISTVNRRRIESSSIRVGAGRSEMFHCQRAQRHFAIQFRNWNGATMGAEVRKI